MGLNGSVRLVSAMLLATAATVIAKAQGPGPQVTPLTQGWHFHFGQERPDDASPAAKAAWQDVSLPHSWNRVGQYEPQSGVPLAQRPIDKKQGIGWYWLDFAVPDLVGGRRAFIQFDAASRMADVWLNGKHIGSHAGGFSRFRFDITPFARAGSVNHLEVKVDNSQPAPDSSTADILPLTGDFFVQGGLYRPVSLIVTSAAHFDLLDDGGSGVYADTTAIAPKSAEVAIVAKLRNDRQADGAFRLTSNLAISAQGSRDAHQILKVALPHLWQGTRSPYLYSLVSELRDARGLLLDRSVQEFGIRKIRIDPAKGLILNGQPTALHGVALHQDVMGAGWAVSDKDVRQVIETVRDMGANSLRLSHYQHGQAIHQLADRYGLILWDEIPLVTAWTTRNDQMQASEGLTANARQQLRELIAQNRNHASVAVWGIANEVDFGPNRPGFLNNGTSSIPDPLPLLKDLNTLAHKLDPSRPTALATCCEDNGMKQIPVVADAADVAGVNRYFGWYYGKAQEMGKHLDGLHAKRPNQPMAVTEYGGGGALSLHTDNVDGGPVDAGGRNQPEEYQAALHERLWPQLAARPWLWATWLWNGFDFGSTVRHEGDAVDINTKGLVSFDGAVRKDAFYYYRANWSDQPTLHIAGRRYVERAYGVTDIKVYSNAPQTELLLNGKSLGSRSNCGNRVCKWENVALRQGDNALAARANFVGKPVSDAIVWHLDAASTNRYRIDAGALVAAKSATGQFGSDSFFKGGTAASMDSTPRYRPAVLAKIQGTTDRDLVASYRMGEFSYQLPVKQGDYRVTLTFAEPSLAAGERVFNVQANGMTAIEALDVAAVAGAPLTAVSRQFVAHAGSKGLMIAFVPAKGQAILSAMTVEPEK